MFGLRSFRSELLLLIIGLFALVLAAVFFAVNQANQSNARSHLEEALSITTFAFQRDLAARDNVLIEKGRLLSADFAFKEAVITDDHDTILSVLENHRMRVGASVMMLATMDGRVIADTLHPKLAESLWTLSSLQASAEQTDTGEANGIQLLDGKPYQLVILPLFTPEPTAWIAIGFEVKDAFSKKLAEQTHSQVSLLYSHDFTDYNDAAWLTLSSTLDVSDQKDLLFHLQERGKSNLAPSKDVEDVDLGGDPYLSRILMIQGSGEGHTIAVLQRSLNKVLEPFMKLRNIMLGLFGLGLMFAVISIFYIARSLSRPLESLTQTVKKIDEGDYQQTDILCRKDEIGTLSSAVNRMSKGLKERDQVRNLLGKVVSPEIATELLSKKIDLGGENREATILFSDIRKFTGFCEKSEPKEILNLLNRYLGGMTKAIESHKGVIDKYIGDAIMALFGVPVELDNAPEQSINAALAMVKALGALNNELEKEALNPIHMGIGINTDMVVAGNMGSVNRLNYTVIGDGVNVASRLEGLTKYFGVSIIVSESTAMACPDILFRDLGSVQVKGKKQGIRIYEPLDLTELSEKEQDLLEQHNLGIKYFRQQDWQQSKVIFEGIMNSKECLRKVDRRIVYQLYIENIDINSQQDMPKNWSGELVFTTK
ncbi:MAG: adenylate/guanylate cyclase domain-containing protein [Cocleimonas sp.]